MTYYDPLYGFIELDDLVVEILDKCPEVKRLRYVGLMNVKSLRMLSLTNISRLEHTIGLAYLAQNFIKFNKFSKKNNLLIASLYHDINCSAFGHAIEWAIKRYTPYIHEDRVDWILEDRKLGFTKNPHFIEPNGLHMFKFKERYNLSFEHILGFIRGTHSFILNNDGIDLDNIDNVYRMGLHLGLLNEDKDIPIQLSNNLQFSESYNNFVIEKEYIPLIDHWHKLRSEIYKLYIYSKEYIGYEYLLTLLVSNYVKYYLSDESDIDRLWLHTDETLINYFFRKKKEYPDLSEIAQRILLFKLDNVYSIVRSKNIEIIDKLYDEKLQKEITHTLANKLSKKFSNQKIIKPENLYLHITTDNKKTERSVSIYCKDENASIAPLTIGNNQSYVVIGILGKYFINLDHIPYITSTLIEILQDFHLGSFEEIPFSDLINTPQLTLFTAK